VTKQGSSQLLSNGAFSENVEDAGEYEDLIAARPSLPPKGAGSVKGHTHFAKSRPIEALEDLSSMYGTANEAPTSQSLLTKRAAQAPSFSHGVSGSPD
jgi:hypothetical protein